MDWAPVSARSEIAVGISHHLVLTMSQGSKTTQTPEDRVVLCGSVVQIVTSSGDTSWVSSGGCSGALASSGE